MRLIIAPVDVNFIAKERALIYECVCFGVHDLFYTLH